MKKNAVDERKHQLMDKQDTVLSLSFYHIRSQSGTIESAATMP